MNPRAIELRETSFRPYGRIVNYSISTTKDKKIQLNQKKCSTNICVCAHQSVYYTFRATGLLLFAPSRFAWKNKKSWFEYRSLSHLSLRYILLLSALLPVR